MTSPFVKQKLELNLVNDVETLVHGLVTTIYKINNPTTINILLLKLQDLYLREIDPGA